MERKQAFNNTNGQNSVVKQTLTRNNIDLVRVNAYAKFDRIPSIRSENIKQKHNLAITKGHNSVVT